jgi:hypothetical protein
MKNIIITVLGLFAIINISYFAVVVPGMDWLHAHGLGAHVPDAGPLREDYEKVASFCALILFGYPMLALTACAMWLCERRGILWWSKKDDEGDGGGEAVAPEWTKQRLAYEQGKRK